MNTSDLSLNKKLFVKNLLDPHYHMTGTVVCIRSYLAGLIYSFDVEFENGEQKSYGWWELNCNFSELP